MKASDELRLQGVRGGRQGMAIGQASLNAA
jgi:hypothetical protein